MSDYFDASDWGSDQDLESGSQPLPGKYHVVVQSVDSSFSKSNSCLLVTFEVLAGTVPGQESKSHTERVPVKPSDNGSKAGMRRGAKFLRAVGLLAPSDLGKPVPVNFQDAVGRDLVIELEKGEKYTNVSFLGFFPTNHEDVRDVPKSNYRFGSGAPGGAPNSAAQPQQQQSQPAQQQAPQAQAAGANGAPDWSSI